MVAVVEGDEHSLRLARPLGAATLHTSLAHPRRAATLRTPSLRHMELAGCCRGPRARLVAGRGRAGYEECRWDSSRCCEEAAHSRRRALGLVLWVRTRDATAPHWHSCSDLLLKVRMRRDRNDLIAEADILPLQRRREVVSRSRSRRAKSDSLVSRRYAVCLL